MDWPASMKLPVTPVVRLTLTYAELAPPGITRSSGSGCAPLIGSNPGCAS
jgi:hypothetical protein